MKLLRNDNISASIPSYIREIQSLTQLDLSFNNIAGQIPDFPFNLSTLTFLFLGNNKLNGTLSATKSSRLLNVSYNNLAGRFPSWISELNLELNLVANNFTVVASNLSGLPSDSQFGGGPPITSSNRVPFDRDNTSLGAASYYVQSNLAMNLPFHGSGGF